MSNDEIPGEFHFVITRIYDSDGECIGISNAVIPGPYEPNEQTLKYWAWLDKRREQLKGNE